MWPRPSTDEKLMANAVILTTFIKPVMAIGEFLGRAMSDEKEQTVLLEILPCFTTHGHKAAVLNLRPNIRML